MHHIIRQLGISLAGHKNIVKAGMSLEEAPSQGEWQKARRISLMFNNMKDLCISPECKNLVTLLVQHNPNLESLCPTFFKFMPSLRVLDLSHTRITTLPFVEHCPSSSISICPTHALRVFLKSFGCSKN
jgi:disease resistance protein RPS2